MGADAAALDAHLRLAPPVTLEAVLDAREARAARQRRVAAAHPGLPVVSLSLNIPGEYKAYPLARDAFRLACALLDRQCARAGLPVAAREEADAPTGFELVAAARGDAAAVKRLTLAIEESHPLGRFFDFDVIGPDGAPLRGEEQGRGERACLVCGGPVWACARSRAHPAEELSRRTARAFRDFFARDFADRVAAQATRALLYEVNVTPKPGLVDRANNGAHRDMDIFTFIDSATALTPYFRDMVLAGLEAAREGRKPEALLPRLRLPGQWAEDAMFAATAGVNTHKGLIFSLGILCAAAGVAKGEGVPPSPDAILALCGRIAGGVESELSAAGSGAPTHGEEAFARFGLTGARGEAARGFPDVRDCGHPVLSALLERGVHPNDAGVVALLRLIARVDDTNIVSRSDLATLRAVREKTAAALDRHGGDIGRLLAFSQTLDAEFIERNLSAGGCADLLALSFMLHFIPR